MSVTNRIFEHDAIRLSNDMNTSSNLLVVGVNRAVIAFEPGTGRRVWQRRLGSGWTNDFVSVVVDSARVYAHTNGHLFCLDLQTGATLWSDGLEGCGYGIATLALPGIPAAPSPEAVAQKRQDDSSSTTDA